MMLTVSQLAKHCNVTPETVRFYSKKKLLKPSKNPNNGYQIFSLDDIPKLKFIRQAKLLGYTLNEIEEILHHSMQSNSPCPIVREFLERRIADNRRKIQALLTLQKRMEAALKDWKDKPNGIPDGNSICHLIESFSEDA
jgi:DNA-binding transcriptional MerR regulator